LGVGMPEEKLNMLSAIASKQEQIMQSLGPVNPLVTLQQYRNTLTRMVELAGFANPNEFFLEVDPQQLQQMTEAAAKDQQPDPATLLAQVQMEEIKARMQMDAMKLQLEAKKQAEEDDRERDKMAADFALAAAEMELKYGTAVNVAEIKANAQSARSQEYANAG